MRVRITEQRYGSAQNAALIELNSSLILFIVSGLSVSMGHYEPALVSLIYAVICFIPAMAMGYRGICYRILSRFGKENGWVLDDLDEIDYQEMRETGSVEIEVPE